jgi:hypothetical protein
LYNRLGFLRVGVVLVCTSDHGKRPEQRFLNRCECAVEAAVLGKAVLAMQQ